MNRIITLSLVVVTLYSLVALRGSAADVKTAGPRVVDGSEQAVTVVFTIRIVNRGQRAVQKPEIWIRLPVKDAHQNIDELEIEGHPRRELDRWQEPVAIYQQPELLPGQVMTGRWTTTCRRRELQWNLSGRRENKAPRLSEEEKALYLRDTDRYGLQTSAVQDALREATAGRTGEIAKLEGIFDYVMNHIKYVIDDYWEPAPKVLASGQGSCSEFTYSFIALCRAAGIPARYVGGITGRPDTPFHVDLIFHRFPQAFVEGVGWVDFDPTRTRRSKNRRLYFGRTSRQMLLLCAGDGGEGSLTGWDYRGAAHWSGKKEKPYANESEENAKTVVLQVGWWFPQPSAEVRQKVAAFRRQWEKTPPEKRQSLIAEALTINHPLVLPWLDDLLYNPATRVETARACLKIGGLEALQAVVDSLGCLDDQQGDRQIGETLNAFTGEKIGADRKKWKKWIKARNSPSPLPKPFDYEAAAKKSPKIRDLWPAAKKHLLPLDWKIERDEIVVSDTDPSLKLRKITAHFWSQEIGGKRWGHPCTVFLPADPAVNAVPARSGKAVIFGAPPGEQYNLSVAKYGEPIAARTKYPVMVFSNPGVYPDGSDIERDIGILGTLARQTGQIYYNMNFQCAVAYIKALDAMQQVLSTRELHAVIGGHSKRGRSALVAAALDPRVASAVEMGNEGVPRTDAANPRLTFHYFKDQVVVPLFYIGATNEDGYAMFNVNVMQEHLCPPMTIEIIPNYCHAVCSEIQFMDFMMWVAHVFDGRPLTRIVEVGHRREGRRSRFTARLEGKAKIQTVKTWYVYTDDPTWRDLMWYHLLMKKTGDHYEGFLRGKIPDAFLIEVGDIAQGFPGYVSSVPQKLTDAPVQERVSRGSLPKLWSPQE